MFVDRKLLQRFSHFLLRVSTELMEKKHTYLFQFARKTKKTKKNGTCQQKKRYMNKNKTNK